MPVNKESKVTIKIPRSLYRKLKEIIEGTGFNSVNDFIVYVLRDLASGRRPKKDLPEGITDPSRLTAEEVEKVRQRLRNLGYL